MTEEKKFFKILITGGAGFIGSNLVDYFLNAGHSVVCMDNLSTGYEANISHHFKNSNFTFINADIRDISSCKNAVKDCDYVLHQAALGSVPRSVNDPITTNDVNISGFLNMLVAARDEKVKRFVYAASSSTYGDSKVLPKVEENIGAPLSPYAITKYVNELYANVFAKTYGIECIGLRYFNVFGKRQSPDGAYAAVIPLWVSKLLKFESPVINGDGNYSRDFTFIDNVILANELALFTHSDVLHEKRLQYYNENELTPDCTFSDVFNVAYGGNTTLNELFLALRDNLSRFDEKIASIEPTYGPERTGDIPHSQASIRKAIHFLGYSPKFSAREGFEKVAGWYYSEGRK